MTPEQQIAEAREICALIRAGKPVPCGKGPADDYLLALDAALSTALSDSKRMKEELEAALDALFQLAEKMVYRGNSVSYIYDKMTCYRDQVGFAFDALRIIGADFSGDDNAQRRERLLQWATNHVSHSKRKEEEAFERGLTFKCDNDQRCQALMKQRDEAREESKRKDEEIAAWKKWIDDALAGKNAAESRLKDAEARVRQLEAACILGDAAIAVARSGLMKENEWIAAGYAQGVEATEARAGKRIADLEAALAEARRERSASEKMREEILSTLHKVMAKRDRLAGLLAKVSETRDHYEKELADAKAKRDKRIYELTEIAYLASLREHLRAALASPAPKEDSK